MADDREILKNQIDAIGRRLAVEGARMDDEPLIIEYDNGGGQSGVRENPYYPAYEKLLASYAKALAAARDLFGEDTQEETQTLNTLRAKFRVTA